MKLRKNIFRRAFTLTELLVVLAIISLLATIAVPVYINRIQQARVAIARAEVREIASAMQQVGIIHGVYVPIHILDNVPNLPGGGLGSPGSRDDFDNLANPASHRTIDAYRDLLDQVGTQTTLAVPTGNSRVDRMVATWQGPFLNPQRVAYVGADSTTGDGGDITLDLVLDPWGQVYRFYTPYGLTGSQAPPTAASINTSQYVLSTDDADLTSTEQDRFDRFAIVSYGADGVTGFNGSDPTDQGDDIVYTFVGVLPTESTYQGF